ncbi:MAG: hypothetical protein HZY73_14985 [Micropruina sp.]|nr:MAG: hypothetical protein HZY73_14985 [Micropruina sp.]
MTDWTASDARVIVDLPDGNPEDLVAAGEVLIQEALTSWALPIERLDELAELRQVFGARARIGVSGLRTAAQVRDAVAGGAAFLLADITREEMLAAAGGLPLALGALTLNEIARAADLSPLVQVIPCDSMGSMYGRSLPALFPDVELIATGRMERFVVELWLEAGAAAACPRGWFSPDSVTEPDLSEFRQRCRALNVADL